jgi:hypothetical protein
VIGLEHHCGGINRGYDGRCLYGARNRQVYDPNGVLLATLCADAVGTRFELYRSWDLVRSIRTKPI